MMLTLDAVRERFPAFALALYALEPGGPITLEILAPDGESFTFTGPTEAAVLERAFPDMTPAAAEPDSPAAELDIFG
jgi:hypothetical protein